MSRTDQNPYELEPIDAVVTLSPATAEERKRVLGLIEEMAGRDAQTDEVLDELRAKVLAGRESKLGG